MPSVDSEEAARELVATQDENPLLDMDTLPFDSSYEAARAAHVGHQGRPGEG
jgi:MHS family proline/betaine transporter-like MFS transporter